MGFFSKLFGGDDDKAAKWQREDNREMLEYTKQMAALARSDVNRLFPEGMKARQAGAQRVLDMFSNVIPQRMGLVQEGRQRVQDTLLGGSELYKRALLGLPTDTSILQKSPMDVDMSWADQTLPALENAAAETEDLGYDTTAIPLNPVYADPAVNAGAGVMSAYDAGASPQASANELAAFNLGVPDVNMDGRISNEEFTELWPGYDAWAQQQGGRFKIHGDRDPGGMSGSRFTGQYDANGNPIFVSPTEMRTAGQMAGLGGPATSADRARIMAMAAQQGAKTGGYFGGMGQSPGSGVSNINDVATILGGGRL